MDSFVKLKKDKERIVAQENERLHVLCVNRITELEKQVADLRQENAINQLYCDKAFDISDSAGEALQISNARIAELEKEVADLKAERTRLQQWVNDLQSGMYINCVYCGHRYGPDPGTPVAMADVLKAHIEQCQEHPMSALKKELAALQAERNRVIDLLINEPYAQKYSTLKQALNILKAGD